MAFPPQFLDEIRVRVPLADVIGRRVRLQKRGKEFLGLCPFHNEKTPSFTVNEDKGFYHCFGCGAHGDVIGFVMQTEGRSFPEAVEDLAARAGLDVPKATPEERAKAKAAESLHAVNEAACAWFEARLRGAEGRAALDYLKGRGLTDETIARFRLGFAPDGRDNLKRHLIKEGVSEELMVEAGLLGQPEDGRATYDRFRSRVIFPISDRRGRVIAFGGRIMGDGQPKYLNSSDTPIFHKGRVLYGHARAAGPVRKGAPLIVTEGYMDVIALHQAGFEGAVAPLGTAMTESHIEMAWRLTDEPVLCFDGDKAGVRAAERTTDKALPLIRPGCTLKYVFLPEGEDPDSFVRSRGAEAFQRRIDGATALSEWLWQMIAAGRSIESPEDASGIERKIDETIVKIAENRSQFYFKVFLRKELWSRIWARRDKKAKKEVIDLKSDVPPEDLLVRSEQGLVASLINHPEMIFENAEKLATIRIRNKYVLELYNALVEISSQFDELDSEFLIGQLEERGFEHHLRMVLSHSVYEAAPFSSPRSYGEMVAFAWDEVFQRLRLDELRAELERATQALRDEQSPATSKWVNVISREIREIQSQSSRLE